MYFGSQYPGFSYLWVTIAAASYKLDEKKHLNKRIFPLFWNKALKASILGQPWEMGWEGGGRGVQDGGHMYTHGQFMSMYDKNHYNILSN